MNRTLLSLVSALCIAALVGCTPAADDASMPPTPPEESVAETPAAEPDAGSAESPSTEAAQIAWLDTELEDAVTGESFRLSDYKGTPLLLHAFAVW